MMLKDLIDSSDVLSAILTTDDEKEISNIIMGGKPKQLN